MILKPDGTIESALSDAEITLGAAKAALNGGYLEAVTTVIPGVQVYVDEDGLAKDLPFNLLASCLCKRNIVGAAVVFRIGAEGESFPLTAEEQRSLQVALEEAAKEYMDGFAQA